MDGINLNLAGICGMYCGKCSKYKNGSCDGCGSDNHYNDHQTCPFYDCAFEKGVNWCFECNLFPCNTLISTTKAKSTSTMIECISNLQQMKQTGVMDWLMKMK